MRALLWNGPRSMSLETIPRPTPGPGEVLLKVEAVGICGSELSGYLGQNSLRTPPLIMGHEFAGVVTEVGHGVAIKVGSTVAVNPLLCCFSCDMCRRGLQQLCRNRLLLGAHRPGAFAEYVSVPESACYSLPRGITSSVGALIEPVACSLRAIRKAEIGPGSRLIIFGAGPIGLFALALALLGGASWVSMVDRVPERLETAKAWGAHSVIQADSADLARVVQEATDYQGVDTALDAVGLSVTRRQAVEVTRPAGRVVLIGLHSAEATLECNTVVRSEITITGTFAYTHQDFSDALTLLAAGRLPSAGNWLDERPLDAGPEAFEELIDRPGRIAKVMLRP